MKKLIVISIALLLLVGLLTAQPFKAKHNNKPGQGKEWKHCDQKTEKAPHDMMMACMDELKLTDAQKKKFEELRAGFHKTQNSLAAEIENLKIDLKAALKAENFKQAKDLNKQIATKENALADARIDFMANRMKELSVEQKEIIKKQMPNMMQQRMHGKQQGQGMTMQKKHMNKGNCDDCNDCGDEHGHGHKNKSDKVSPK